MKQIALTILFVGIALCAESFAQKVDSREEVIARQLDCVSEHLSAGEELAWGNVCYVNNREMAIEQALDEYSERITKGLPLAGNQQPEEPAPRYPESVQSDSVEEPLRIEHMPLQDDAILRRGISAKAPLRKFDVGTEASYIVYREPGLMRQKGYMYGMFAAYTHRISENKHIQSLWDTFKDENKINMFKVDGKFSWGYVDYESEGTGTMDNLRDYMIEIRGVAGYDFPIGEVSRITPYGGFGYRYLNDDLRGKSTTGATGYIREANYYYVPLGLEGATVLKDSWLLEVVLEYDFFITGTQESHFENIDPRYNTLKNEQRDGYGMRGSFKIMKEQENLTVYLEPFIRYWSIKDSEVSTWTLSGIPIGLGWEPENNSTEFGFKMGAQF